MVSVVLAENPPELALPFMIQGKVPDIVPPPCAMIVTRADPPNGIVADD